MDDKVSVSIREIENGYLVDRSWCEKKKRKNGEGMDYDYHNETYYLGSLPPLLKKMFTKGKNGQDFGGKTPDGKDSFEKALDEMDEDPEEEASESQDEEDQEDSEEE